MKNDAYVYKHKTNNGEVFYVGMSSNNKNGKYTRQYNKSRTESWREMQSGGYTIEIVAEDLSVGEAIQLEAELIESYTRGGKLINVRNPNANESEENFFYVFQQQEDLTHLLNGRTNQLMMQLCALCEYNKNSLVLTEETKKYLIREVQQTRSQLSKYLYDLKDKNAIDINQELIIINPLYFWKGDLEKRYRKLKINL